MLHIGHQPHASRKGFTIVELLVVIVVLAILTSIVVVTYSGVHEKARDTTRLNDATAIKEALETYRASKGTYPASVAGPYNGWDSSADPAKSFLTNLQQSGYMDIVPKDPTNTAPTGSNWTTGYRYEYLYSSDPTFLSSNGCATNRGGVAVLIVVNMEVAGNPSPSSPGFSCTSRNFNAEGSWVWGDYDKPA
jgi:type II secretion system protein G